MAYDHLNAEDLDPEYQTVTSLDRYVVSSAGNEYELLYSYSEEGYSYYCLHLGQVTNVPISYTSVMWGGSGPSLNVTYSSSETTEEEVTNTSAFCITETTERVDFEDESTHYNVKAGFEVGTDIAKVKAEVELGWEGRMGYSLSTTNSGSKTDSYSTLSGWAKSEARTAGFTVGENDKAGVYRLGAFSVCDVYAVVVINNSNKDCYYEYVTSAREESFAVALDWSPNGNFQKNNNTPKLKLTEEMLASLPKTVAEHEGYEDDSVKKYTLADLHAGTVTIPASVQEVLLVGDVSKTFTKNIVISPRNSDLKITMDNVKLTAPAGTAAIRDEGTAATPHTITLVVIGENIITAGNGTNGSVRQSGGTGAIGLDAGSNHSISVVGTGNLTILGGRGGNGGAGGNTDSSDLNTRLGGAGGRGGFGIKCKSVSFGDAIGTITIEGGAGEYAVNAGTAPEQPAIEPVSFVGGKGGIGGNGGSKNSSIGAADGSAGKTGNSVANGHWWDGSKVVSL